MFRLEWNGNDKVLLSIDPPPSFSKSSEALSHRTIPENSLDFTKSIILNLAWRRSSQ